MKPRARPLLVLGALVLAAAPVTAARAVADAKDLEAASLGAAAIARTCGERHAAFARPRNVVVAEPPPPSRDVVPMPPALRQAAARDARTVEDTPRGDALA